MVSIPMPHKSIPRGKIMKNVANYAVLSGKNAQSVDHVIETAIKSAKTMREKVQIAGVAILMHAEKHGDYSKAGVLVDGLGNGVNGAALVAWLIKFGGLEVGKVEVDGKKVDGFVGWKGKQHIRDNFAEAKAVAWWDFKQASPYKGFNLKDALTATIKQAKAAQAKIDDAKAEGDDDLAKMLSEVVDVDGDLLASLQKLVA